LEKAQSGTNLSAFFPKLAPNIFVFSKSMPQERAKIARLPLTIN
jgi:hypothetical protein